MKDKPIPPQKKPVFRINKFLSVHLENFETTIYVAGEPFHQCKYLAFNLDANNLQQYDTINSIDDLEQTDRSSQFNTLQITPETEFKGHCSNLQAWYENDYDTRLLHRNLAFPLLKKLTEAGDPQAKKRFKEEIARRYTEGNKVVQKYLKKQMYLSYLSSTELEELGCFSQEDIEILRHIEKLKEIQDFRRNDDAIWILTTYKKAWKNENGLTRNEVFYLNQGFYICRNKIVGPDYKTICKYRTKRPGDVITCKLEYSERPYPCNPNPNPKGYELNKGANINCDPIYSGRFVKSMEAINFLNNMEIRKEYKLRKYKFKRFTMFAPFFSKKDKIKRLSLFILFFLLSTFYFVIIHPVFRNPLLSLIISLPISLLLFSLLFILILDTINRIKVDSEITSFLESNKNLGVED